MIGEIITAGASLLGSIFGKKSQKTKTSIDLTELVNQANGNGFNPLTVLRNGGSAGFTTTTSPTVSQLPEALGNLGGVLGGALENRLDPINAKKREIDTLLVDRQLRQLKEGPQIAGRLYAPRTYTGTKVSQQLVPRLGASSHKQTAAVPAAAKADNPVGYEQNDAKLTRFGNQEVWKPNEYLPDASSYEDRYGELGGSALGIINGVGDIYSNGVRWAKSAYNDYVLQAPRKGFSIEAKPPALGGWAKRRVQRPRSAAGGGW